MDCSAVIFDTTTILRIEIAARSLAVQNISLETTVVSTGCFDLQRRTRAHSWTRRQASIISISSMGERIPKWAVTPERTGILYLEMVLPLERAPNNCNERWCIDRKAGYLLGRNSDAVDVTVDHKSASRVHACLVHNSAGDIHLIDLGSVHGKPGQSTRLQ